ncbi:MAG: hypothetical protein Q8O14_12820 [bacterium]|nr:hypothetical protein [bacterium]
MSYLTASEAAFALTDVAFLLASTGDVIQLCQRQTPPASGFAGDPAPEFGSPVAVPAVLTAKAPEDLLQVGHELLVLVGPSTVVVEGDEFTHGGHQYQVEDVVPRNLFGTVTHLELSTKQLHGSA